MTNNKKLAPQPSVAFDPWVLWVALRRHWAWVLPSGVLIATVASFLIFYTFVPEYEATQILQANHDFVLSRELVDVPKDLSKSERQLILSPVVMTEVLADPELRSVPSLSNSETRESEIRKRVKISNGGAENLLLISYRDIDRDQVAKVANAIAASYVQERKRFDALRLKNVIDSLTKPIEQFERMVKEDREQLMELSEKYTGVNPFKSTSESASGSSILEKLLEKQFEFDVELNLLNDKLETLKASLEVNTEGEELSVAREREIDNHVLSDPAVKELADKIALNLTQMRKIEHNEKMSQVTMSVGLYNSLKKDVDNWNRQLDKLKTETRSKLVVALREEDKRKQLEAIKATESQIRNLSVAKEKVVADFEKEKEKLGKFGGETAELYFARERYEEHRKALSNLSTRRIALQAEQGKSAGSVTLRSIATKPYAPIEETPIKKVAMAGGIAFLIPFLLALLIEFQAKRITNAESIDSNQLIPILGEIARIPRGRKRTSVHRMFEESIDAMRANLLFKMENVRSIAVTSAISGEGKSNVAFHLAHSIARCTGANVLIIDADLRRPDQHDLFGLELGPGLCKLIMNEANLDECIESNEGELVHLLSAGRLDTNPHNLLSRNNFERVLSRCQVNTVTLLLILPRCCLRQKLLLSPQHAMPLCFARCETSASWSM